MSGTVIDKLIVTLGLDPSAFNQGQKDAASQLAGFEQKVTKSHDVVAKSTKSVSEGFETASRLALGFFAIVAGGRGIQELFANSVQTSAAIGRLAGNINMSTSALSGWENAAKGAGGTADGMASTLTDISQAFEKQKMGIATPMMTGLMALGIQTTDGNGNPLPPDQIALALSAKFASLPKSQALTDAGMLGIDQGTFNFLDQGPAAVAAQVGANTNTTGPESAAAIKLTLAFTQMESTVDGLSNTLMALSAPWLAQQINDFARGLWAINQVLSGKMTWSQLGDAFAQGVSGDYQSTPHPQRGGGMFKPLGVRNNNPGNLRYVGQTGANPDANGFAVFDTLQAGTDALKAQIGLDGSRGYNTVSSLITNYEGGTNPNDTGAGNVDHNNIAAYIADVSNKMGVSPNTPLDMSNPATQSALAAAIASHEGNATYGAGASNVIPLSSRVNNVLSGLRGVKNLQNATGRQGNVAINTVHINAPSADPKKVVAQMGKTLSSTIMAHQANTGLF